MENRTGSCDRKTQETQISLALTIDGKGIYSIKTGIGFFDHMLELFAKHGRFDLSLQCTGDLNVDAHHTVEDVGLALGEALSKALSDKRGIRRYGSCFLPMDEVLALTAIDLSGRPFFVLDGTLPTAELGGFSPELVFDFFKAVSDSAKMTLHIKLFYGRNSHHCIEAIFKGFARALAQALERIPGDNSIPSTKGVL